MKKVISYVLIAVVLAATLVMLAPATTTAASTHVTKKSPLNAGLQQIRTLSLLPSGLKITGVIVLKKGTPYAKALAIYNAFKKERIKFLNTHFSMVVSRLVKNRLGEYMFKVIGPAGKIAALARGFKAHILGVLARPLINFETALDNAKYLPPKLIGAATPRKGVPRADMFFIRYLIGAAQVYQEFGINGSGVKIAIVDTGVDYGNPDLQSKLVYYVGTYNGSKIREPLVLDADESQVILLDSFTANTTGWINVGGANLTVLMPWPTKVKPPYTAYYVGNVTSASGTYKFGVLNESLIVGYTPYGEPITKWVRVGVLMTDPVTAGNYTTLIIDANNDSIFNDTGDIIVTYDGNRILAAYKAGSSIPYESFGVAGGFFFDTYMYFSNVSKIYPGWSLKGRYISIFYDFFGHGTQCAAAAAGAGKTVYHIEIAPGYYFNTTLPGIAPGAKIVGVKGLWIGNVEIGMLWAAGFNINASGYLYYTGKPLVQVISNSWGISYFPYDIAGFGYDFESLVINAIMTPGFLNASYPGVLVVQAAGNGGPGYGTITSPGAAIEALTVGASTSYHLYYYLYGFGGITYDNIISWSARGPTVAGYIKPDVVNVGAWGMTAAPIGINQTGYQWFGGTSFATPLTAGVAALMYQAANYTLPPQEAKYIIMSTAKYLNYPPFEQGAGRVNALKAVERTLELKGLLPTSDRLSIYGHEYAGFVSKLSHAWFWMWSDYFNLYLMYLYSDFMPIPKPQIPASQLSSVKTYAIYVPDIKRGMLRTFHFVISNPSSKLARVTAEALKAVRIASRTYYVRLTLPANQWMTYKYIVIPRTEIPPGTDFMTVTAYMPYRVFDGNNNYEADYQVIVVAYVWIADSNHNGIPDVWERAVVNEGYCMADNNLVQIGNPTALLKSFGPDAKLLIRVYILRGNDPHPAVPELKNQLVRVTVNYYSFKPDNWVRIYLHYGNVAYLRGGESIKATGIIRVPIYAAPTAYQDFIKVTARFSDGVQKTYYIPMSYTVYTILRAGWTKVLNNAPGAQSVPYSWKYLKGDNDWMWRYESGDWRVFYVLINDPKVWYMECKVMWFDPYTSLVEYTLGPDGQFAGYFMGSGISYQAWVEYTGIFLWLGTGRSAFKNYIVTFPVTTYRVGQYPTPKPNLGIYTFVVRTVEYGGYGYEEPFLIMVRAVRGLRMLPDHVMPISGSYTTFLYVPYYRPSEVTAKLLQPMLPVFSTQTLNSYTYLNVLPSEYTHYMLVYRFLLKWGGLKYYGGRTDLAIEYNMTIPQLMVYIRYGWHLYPGNDLYVLQDWMMTGSPYFILFG